MPKYHFLFIICTHTRSRSLNDCRQAETRPRLKDGGVGVKESNKMTIINLFPFPIML